MLRALLIISLFMVSQISWAGRIALSPAANKVTKKKVISVWAEWIKDKGEKFDVRLGMQNVGDTPMIVLLRDIGCTKGSSMGNMKHTFFNTGEKTIDFNGGETKTMNLVCRLPHDTTGLLGVEIRKVYENKNGDGETLGKVIAKNIKWEPETQKNKK